MSKSVLVKLATVGAGCAAVGAGAGILGTAAASSTSAPAKHHHGRHHGVLARALHADAVVPAKGGKFVEITLDRGTVQSVSGQQLTLAEGTRAHVYKTVTLTIPAGARIRDNRQAAQLSDVKPGQRAVVIQRPNKTLVIARTPRSS
jgi:hypothetical protein